MRGFPPSIEVRATLARTGEGLYAQKSRVALFSGKINVGRAHASIHFIPYSLLNPLRGTVLVKEQHGKNRKNRGPQEDGHYQEHGLPEVRQADPHREAGEGP